MGDIQLTLACEDYDRTRALRDGSVKPEGIALLLTTFILSGWQIAVVRRYRGPVCPVVSIPGRKEFSGR